MHSLPKFEAHPNQKPATGVSGVQKEITCHRDAVNPGMCRATNDPPDAGKRRMHPKDPVKWDSGVLQCRRLNSGFTLLHLSVEAVDSTC